MVMLPALCRSRRHILVSSTLASPLPRTVATARHRPPVAKARSPTVTTRIFRSSTLAPELTRSTAPLKRATTASGSLLLSRLCGHSHANVLRTTTFQESKSLTVDAQDSFGLDPIRVYKLPPPGDQQNAIAIPPTWHRCPRTPARIDDSGTLSGLHESPVVRTPPQTHLFTLIRALALRAGRRRCLPGPPHQPVVAHHGRSTILSQQTF